MTTKNIIVIIISIISNYSVGQKTFTLMNSSKEYSAIINVGKCDSWYCQGKGSVKVYDKKSKKLIQTFSSENLFTELNRKTGLPTESHHQLYDGTSVLIFDDFDFDGFEDLAIRNGNLGSYSGPSYDIYIYIKNKNKFKLDNEFTNIASYTGMFFIDKKRKRLITNEAAGYSEHITTEYKISSKKPIKVLIVTEKNLNGNSNEFERTTQTLIKNKWKTSKKKYKVPDSKKK